MIPLLPDGRAALVTSDELARMPRNDLLTWCYQTGRYTIVTTELVEWLRGQIGDRLAIEVGAGSGDLGYHLGIRQSDSAVQSEAGLRFFYSLLGQTSTEPPPDVVRCTANEAVARYHPDVVIASWLTQRYEPGDEGGESGAAAIVSPKIGSSIYGADEFEIVERATYIHIGNKRVHRDKRIFQLPHQEYSFPWIWSRAQKPEDNRIWIWQRGARA